MGLCPVQMTPRLVDIQLTAGFFFFLGYRRIVHPPSGDKGTERTWFEPEQRP